MVYADSESGMYAEPLEFKILEEVFFCKKNNSRNQMTSRVVGIELSNPIIQ